MSDTENNLFDDVVDLDASEETMKIGISKPGKRRLQIQSADSDMEDSDNDVGDESDNDNDVDIEAANDIEDEDEDDNIDLDDDDMEDNVDVEDTDEENEGVGDYDDENDDEVSKKNTKKKSGVLNSELPAAPGTAVTNQPMYEEDEDDEDADEFYLQKLDNNVKENYVNDYHPEIFMSNYEEIVALSKVVRDKNNIIVDPLHRTFPVLTKYERARVLGQRAKQLNDGARPYINVPEKVIDGHIIAQLELEQKRIPFIIRRPLPGSSGSEYWPLKELELITG